MLVKALETCTARGVLDELAARLHPDAIKAFCDAVADTVTEAAKLIPEQPKPQQGALLSVECPFCKWGFHPSVIEQHIRDKHT